MLFVLKMSQILKFVKEKERLNISYVIKSHISFVFPICDAGSFVFHL